MHSDGKKRRSFLALLFAAGDFLVYTFLFLPVHERDFAFGALKTVHISLINVHLLLFPQITH